MHLISLIKQFRVLTIQIIRIKINMRYNFACHISAEAFILALKYLFRNFWASKLYQKKQIIVENVNVTVFMSEKINRNSIKKGTQMLESPKKSNMTNFKTGKRFRLLLSF